MISRILLTAVLTAMLCSAETTVTMKAAGSVTGTVIRLKDAAAVSGEHKQLLDTLEIGKSSAPGCSRFVLRDDVLLFNTLPEAVRKSVLLTGETRCLVTTEHREIRLTDIEQQVREQLLKSIGWEPKNCRISFRDSTSVLTKIGKGDFTVRIGEMRSKYAKGNILVPVILDQGERKERISLQALVEVSADVFQANRRIDAGEEIRISDLTRKRMDITMLPSVPFTEFVPGQIYRIKGGIIPEGTVVMSHRIEKKPSIETGQTVTIQTRVGTASLAITGTARQAGNIGDRIAVENSTSRKIIKGTIIQPGVVRVDQGGGA